MAEKPQPVRVLYCQVCSLPAEYCEFGSDFEKCKPWLIQNAPDLYPDLLKGFPNTQNPNTPFFNSFESGILFLNAQRLIQRKLIKLLSNYSRLLFLLVPPMDRLLLVSSSMSFYCHE